jgi:predicted transcriptional regulator
MTEVFCIIKSKVINVNALNELLSEMGSKPYRFARDAGIDPGYVYRVLRYQVNPGMAFLEALISWCHKNNQDITKVINIGKE